ncbi:ATP-binding protein [Streptomyces sp. NPDC098789]|uniref:ATP-binding protein n=1 Tax=Streptomyces sp. NPDC098789 TaxID=3366098 RepID=UPI003804AC44
MTPSDAADARARVAALLDGGPDAGGPVVSGAARADALLVTSELVTNAFRHGGGLAGFEAVVDSDALEITVTDRSCELPHSAAGRPIRPGAPGGGAIEGGFGWPLVRLLADRVSVAPLPTGGKTVRVRLRLR